jgi:hypothetical protein
MPWGGGRGLCFGGRGGRRGLYAFGAPDSTVGETDSLRAELQAAKEQVATLEARLSALENKD